MTDLVPAVASFLERARAYAKRAGVQPSTLSRKIFNDGKTLDRLEGGANVGVYTLRDAEAALAKLEAGLERPDSDESTAVGGHAA